MQTSSDLHFFDLSERREKTGQHKIKAKLKFCHLKSTWIHLKPPLLAAVKAQPTTATWGAAAATISPLLLQCRGSPGATGDGRRGANAKLRPTWASAMVPVDLIVLNLGILYVHICCLLGFVMTWIWDEGNLRGGSYIIPYHAVNHRGLNHRGLSQGLRKHLSFIPSKGGTPLSAHAVVFRLMWSHELMLLTSGDHPEVSDDKES